MRAAAALLLIGGLAPMVTGCASMRAYQHRIAVQKRAAQSAPTSSAPATTAKAEGGQIVVLTNVHELPPPDGVAPRPRGSTTPAPVAPVPPEYQFLYGSGEAGALQLTAMHALIAYALDKAKNRPANSVVLAASSPLVKASFVPCTAPRLAVVFDVDETVLLNLGFEARAAAGQPYSKAEWDQWERTGGAAVAAVPGVEHAFEDLRKAGVTVVLNTNRAAANADATIATLKQAGLGDFVRGETLFLQGDDDQGPQKDGRRATIAARYCVIAMAGDQLGDFSDRFADPMPVAQRRQLAVHSSAAGLWGKGWFVLPNPVYGAALKGGLDDVFPADKRWTPTP